MAVPSSGSLSLFGIAKEVKLSNYNNTIPPTTFVQYQATISLGQMSTSGGNYPDINTSNSSSDRPDGETPHTMSEFYSYDHDLVPVGPAFYMTNAGVVATSATAAYACNYIFGGSYYASIYYHDGNGSTPVVGDTVYIDAAGNTEYNTTGVSTTAKWKGNATGNTSGGTGLYRFDANSGEVKQVYTCGMSSFSSSSNNNASNVCSASMNQTYYHNGSGSTPVAGNYVYSSNTGSYPYLSGGNYKISSSQYITVGENGLVSSVNDCVSLTSFSSGSGQTDAKFICSQSVNTTKYHDGSGTNPQVNDNVYNDEDGDQATANGFYALGSSNNTLGYYRIVDGAVYSMGLC